MGNAKHPGDCCTSVIDTDTSVADMGTLVLDMGTYANGTGTHIIDMGVSIQRVHGLCGSHFGCEVLVEWPGFGHYVASWPLVRL